MTPIRPLSALAPLLLLAAGPALARPTHVMVRVQSADAKFIGTHTGGARITLVNARTGVVLARGLTTGGTGDTARIMMAPHERGLPLAIGDTAGFDAVIDVDQPTLVRAEVRAPMGRPASAVAVSSSLWVIPGRDIAGDGWLIPIPGLVVEPRATVDASGAVAVSAKVTLMCGCPIEPGGLWDAAHYTVSATLLRGSHAVMTAPLAYAGQTSQFAGAFGKAAPGRYRVRVVAVDSTTPNAGVVDIPVKVRAPG